MFAFLIRAIKNSEQGSAYPAVDSQRKTFENKPVSRDTRDPGGDVFRRTGRAGGLSVGLTLLELHQTQRCSSCFVGTI